MVKVLLKDGTYLECSIYETGQKGEYPIVNHERIQYLFGSNNLINFQTEMINGRFHSTNVIWYSITHDNEYSYIYPREDGYMRDWC